MFGPLIAFPAHAKRINDATKAAVDRQEEVK